MSTAPPYTLRAIARTLDLPESTVRYYRDQFEPYLPAEGRGRRRRYGEEALRRLRLIAEGFAEGRRREEIEVSLAQETGVAPRPTALTVHGSRRVSDGGAARELLSIVLDGERERREVMWQMAREIVRLGEAIERQQVVLGAIARRIDERADRTLPSSPDIEILDPTAQPGGLEHGAHARELDTLREELAREREIVDRLRRSKLEIERRAAEAEAALESAGLARRAGR